MAIDIRAARKHLLKAEPKFAAVIDSAPSPPDGAFGRTGSVFAHLLQAIVYQQLSGKAAATIHGRVLACLGGMEDSPNFEPDPARLLKIKPEQLRSCGLSAAKLAAARDLAERVVAGLVPNCDQMAELSDDEVLGAVTSVRGIGVWTGQMFLMFRLGRPDVLPAADLGIRKGFALTISNRVAKAKDGLPTPDAILRRGEAWAPWRTVASWYLWRSLEQ